MTILLPVWRFWPFRVIKTVGNGGNGDVPGRETCQILGHREIEGGGGVVENLTRRPGHPEATVCHRAELACGGAGQQPREHDPHF